MEAAAPNTLARESAAPKTPGSAAHRLGLAFAGLGQAVARIFDHNPRLQAQVPYRFVGAFEPRSQAAAKFRDDFGAKIYGSFEELCSDTAVDVVYIATPPALHCAQAVFAASHGKHVVVEKPMALTIDECTEMISAAEGAGVKLMAGHTHSFDLPILRLSEMIDSGHFGRLIMLNSWCFNDFNARPWPTRELSASHGPVLNQGPHQVDIVRQLGGGMVRSVRATSPFDDLRGCPAGYQCLLEFDEGVAATLVLDGRGLFDTAEFYGWAGEGGASRTPDLGLWVRRQYRQLLRLAPSDREAALHEQMDAARYGGSALTPDQLALWGYGDPAELARQPFFGMTIVSCSEATIRQSRDGLIVYSDQGRNEMRLPTATRGRASELLELYRSITEDEPLAHDGRWGRATLEVCLAILKSGSEHREVQMEHQVALRGGRIGGQVDAGERGVPRQSETERGDG
jgi:phthalate 4,5-cis-dihydrodiol dehydrogenase